MAVEWHEWSDAKAEADWDASLEKWSDYTVLQSYRWAEYKRGHGWRVRRGTLLVDGTPVGMAQCLVREVRPLRTVVAWVPGGPAGDWSAVFALGPALRRRYRGWQLSLRANIVLEQWPGYEEHLTRSGWRRSLDRLGTPLTFWVNLSQDVASLRKALSANWRHNLSRGQQRGGRIERCEAERSIEPLYRVYRETLRMKRLREAFSLVDLHALRAAFGDRFVLMSTVGEGGVAESMRGFLSVGTRALDFIASASMAGRKRYANYSLLWSLFDIARARGIRRYDMGGADPESAAGVYHFKKGLGAAAVPLVGEWGWDTSSLVRWAVNRTIARREQSRQPASAPSLE